VCNGKVIRPTPIALCTHLGKMWVVAI
jgi:hypothetical protein